MNEICGRLDTYLSRFHAHRLGLVEENGRVFSDQLSLFSICFLVSGRRSELQIALLHLSGGKDLFFGNDAGQITASQNARYFRSIEIKDYFQETDAGILMRSCIFLLSMSLHRLSRRWISKPLLKRLMIR